MGLTASSLNLTQYDVEEVQEHCGGRFNHREIQCLYKRFRALDKRHKGYVSEDELLSIPELAISPLASRVVQVFQNLNFKDFVLMLAAFSDRASREEKLEFMFRVRVGPLVAIPISSHFISIHLISSHLISSVRPSSSSVCRLTRRPSAHPLRLRLQVYDVDRDGFISLSDLETIVKHLVGSSLNEEQVALLITRAMGELAERRKRDKRYRDGDGNAGSGGITFGEFQVILEGAEKLPNVVVPVGFD